MFLIFSKSSSLIDLYNSFNNFSFNNLFVIKISILYIKHKKIFIYLIKLTTLPRALTSLTLRHQLKFKVWTPPRALTSLTVSQ